jgi:hypothetical protein
MKTIFQNEKSSEEEAEKRKQRKPLIEPKGETEA